MPSHGVVPSVYGSAENALGNELERLEAEYRRVGLTRAMFRRQRNESLPIYRLPDEILWLIFEECFESQESARRQTDRLPLNVAAVSVRWREVALSFPLIWSRLDFCLRQSSPHDSRHATPGMLEQVLMRSKNLPIYIDVHDLSYDDPRDVSYFNRSWLALSRTAFRCRSLTFHVESAKGIERFHDAFQVDMPMLQELALLHAGNPRDTLAHLSLRTYLPIESRSLKSLTLSHIGLLLDDNQIVLEGLRSLKLCDAFIRPKSANDELLAYTRQPTHFRTLAKASNLVNLELQSLLDWEEWEQSFWESDQNTTLDFPNLSTLSITVRPKEDVTYRLLAILQAPSLQKLVIARDPRVHPSAEETVLIYYDDMHPFAENIRMFSLQELCLVGCSFQRPQWLVEFLLNCLYLHTLRLRSCTVDTFSISRLESHISDGVPEVCPLLKTIELQGVLPARPSTEYAPFTFDSLLKMVRARYHAGHGIVNLSLSEARFSPPTAEEPSEPTRLKQDELLSEYVSNVHWCL